MLKPIWTCAIGRCACERARTPTVRSAPASCRLEEVQAYSRREYTKWQGVLKVAGSTQSDREYTKWQGVLKAIGSSCHYTVVPTPYFLPPESAGPVKALHGYPGRLEWHRPSPRVCRASPLFAWQCLRRTSAKSYCDNAMPSPFARSNSRPLKPGNGNARAIDAAKRWLAAQTIVTRRDALHAALRRGPAPSCGLVHRSDLVDGQARRRRAVVEREAVPVRNMPRGVAAQRFTGQVASISHSTGALWDGADLYRTQLLFADAAYLQRRDIRPAMMQRSYWHVPRITKDICKPRNREALQ